LLCKKNKYPIISQIEEARRMRKFIKMHGLGNDFVIFDHRSGAKTWQEAEIRHICDRRLGVGCDQLIVLEPSEKADFFMRIYNPDASQSEACGNATRCVADLYLKESGADRCQIETLGGILSARAVDGGLIEVDMGPPKLPSEAFTDVIDGLSDPVLVDMGNPHAVYFVEDLGLINIPQTGAKIEYHEFFPNRTNVEFVEVRSRDHVRLRTWERGAGLTLACGSAACATVVAGVTKGLTDRQVRMDLDGGQLFMEWREADGHVLMTGPAAYIFEGELRESI